MIVFLPVSRYRVEFQVASGRPFSTFERLVLAAINDASNTLDALALIFGVHRRLIVEAVVTLMQAGWVSLGAKSHEFIVTAAGKLACGDQAQLPPTIILDNRVQTIVVEKVTGQIARNNEIDFYPKSKLRKLWSSGIVFPKGDISNLVDPGMVAPLLLHDSTEWVRSIERPYVVSDNTAYVVAEVDLRNDRIMGLPRSWETILAPELIERVRKHEQRLIRSGELLDDTELKSFVRTPRTVEAEESSGDLRSWVPISPNENDFLKQPNDHLTVLEHFLSNATSYVAISSASLASPGVERILPLFERALQRDILISVIWGQPSADSADHKNSLERLRKMVYDSGKGPNVGRLVINAAHSGSSANILLADLADGIEVVVGSYSWAASSGIESEKHFSIRLRNPRLVARLCDILRDLSAADEKLRVSSSIVRLEKGAEELRALAHRNASGDETTHACLLLDIDHRALLHEALSTAKQSVEICTNELNLDALTGLPPQLMAATVMLGDAVKIRYGRNVSSRETQVLLEELAKQGASVAPLPGLQSNLLCIDGRLCVNSSYRWLSRPTPSHRPYATDIGIAVRSETLAKLIPNDLFE
jgi:hypothetical protein